MGGTGMSSTNPIHTSTPIHIADLNAFENDDNEVKMRSSTQSSQLDVLTDIYQEDINMAIWQRELPETLQNSISDYVKAYPAFQVKMTVTPESALLSINEALRNRVSHELGENIAELVDMFCCLFELERVGLRLSVLDQAMCPKFHVDKVTCRLVTTFQGIATEWLPHQLADRSKLGLGSNGLPDNESGLYENPQDIQQLNSGEVALLKGELWMGNENAGVIHRSPALKGGEQRLLLTLDFSY